MPAHVSSVHRWRFMGNAVSFFLCFLALSACGTNAGAGGLIPSPTSQGQVSSTSPASSLPTSTAIVASPVSTSAAQRQANTHNCPNSTTVTNPPSAANVTLKSTHNNVVVNVKKGDIIEVDLLFGLIWQGPTNAFQHMLDLQAPAGYASSTANACVWRFIATDVGTVNLVFNGLPVCKKSNRECPMNVVDIEFTLNIT